MFDKLFNMMHKIEPETSKSEGPKGKSGYEAPARSIKGKENFPGKTINMSIDPFNRKSEIGKTDRIQQKMELLKQLKEELGIE